jgi:hypothetical protein
MIAAGAADLDADDHGERLAAVVFFEVEGLGDAVVGEDEVGGFEGVDELAGFGFDEGRDQDEGGVDGEREGLLRVGGLLRRLLGAGGGYGEEEREGEESFHGLWFEFRLRRESVKENAEEPKGAEVSQRKATTNAVLLRCDAAGGVESLRPAHDDETVMNGAPEFLRPMRANMK